MWSGPIFLGTLFPLFYGYYFLSLPIFITFFFFFSSSSSSSSCFIFHFEMNSYGVRLDILAKNVFGSGCSLQMHLLLLILLPDSSGNHLTICTLSLSSCEMIRCVHSVLVYCSRYVPVSIPVQI